MKILRLPVLLLLFALTSEVSAGWVIQVRYSNPEGDINEEILMIQDNMLRSTGADGTFIFDLISDKLTVINDEKKTFWEEKISSVRASYYLATKNLIEEILKTMPEQEIALYRKVFEEMEKMYANIDPQKIKSVNITVQKTDQTEVIAGFLAKKYTILVDDSLVETKWLAKDLDTSSDVNLRKMIESFNEISPLASDDPLYERTETYLRLYENGFEVRSSDSRGQQTEVVSAEKKLIDSATFRVPENYKQITIGEMMMMELDSAGKKN